MDNWLNVGIKGHATWPTKETTVKFSGHELLLKPGTKNTEQSIHVNLNKISQQGALTLINRFLSILSWCSATPMENLYGHSGSVVSAAIQRRTTRAFGSCICDYPFYRKIEEDPKVRLALALYREALTVNSIPFSFLSYFKILNIFWARSNELIEGIRQTLPAIKDEQAIERVEKLQKTESDVPKYLYESGRCAIAHAYSDLLVDPDDVTELRRLSQDRWVIRAIAEYLIKNNLNVSRSILG
jgi:hypothetical protein